MTVSESHIAIGERYPLAAAREAHRLDEDILGFAPIGPAVHAQRTTDRTRDPTQERQAGNASIGGRAGNLHVGRAGAGTDTVIGLDGDLREALAQSDHHPGPATVADE